MLFNSIEFLFFFPIVTLLYFILPHKFRWSLLLLASCFFYMFFKPIYILILFFTIIIDYFAGILIESTADKKQKKLCLIASLIANIGVLAVFKYYNFLNENISGLAGLFGYKNHIPYLSILLPIGLSFHTFQAMSYTIEVYRGKQKAERHFGIYALYVMFYPQLVAGPIERPQNILHQFHEKHYFKYENMVRGLRLMLWGFFIKLVIADRLSIAVNHVYNNPHDKEGLTLIIATVFFSFQIYCDFAGYSTIAVGLAKILGIDLMINFDRPYFSKSVSEFWNRWHISLSTWFRDYLYFPLGGNRCKTSRWCFNIMVTFLISGIWHGANWTFVIWGGLNGFFILMSHLTKNLRQEILKIIPMQKFPFFQKAFQVSVTFVLVSFAWIFFRANHVQDAGYIITHMFSGLDGLSVHYVKESIHQLGMNRSDFLIAIFSLGFLLSVEMLLRKKSLYELLQAKPQWLRWSAYYAIGIFILTLGVFSKTQFIYFQF